MDRAYLERPTGMRDVMRNVLGRSLPALALLALLGTAACTDLTETPYTEITQNNFHPQAGDLAALIAPSYVPMRSIWMGWYGAVDWQGESSDELVTPVRPNGWYDGGVYIQNHYHTWNSSSPGMPNSLWGNAYAGINAANRVIFQIDSSVIPLGDSAKAATLAELKAVRAYYYMLLLDRFGNVPIVTDFKATGAPAQSTRQQVYDFVLKEFTDALPKLPTAVGTATYGRMTQWAVKGFMARIYLNAGVYTGTPQWQNVLSLTQDIISSGKFSLDPVYRHVFSRVNQTSPEMVFAVPYDAVYGTESSFHMKTLKPDLRFVFNLNAQPWGGSAANPQLVDSFDKDDGRLTDSFLMGPQFDAQGRGYNFTKSISKITFAQFNEGYPIWKYEIYAGETGSSDVDFPDLRYAEILMMRAEALLRTGDAAGAAALVTQVRQRDFKGAAAGKATVTGADLQQGSSYNYGWVDTDGVVKTGPGGTPVTNGGADIQYGRFLDELRWEFNMEAKQRMNMIRFGVFQTKTWFNHKPLPDEAIRTIYPIPQSRMNVNPNLKQNPGY